MSEYEIAIMEAERNHAEDEYFKARPQIDTGHCRHLFNAGFERAWQASRAQSDAEPVGEIVTKPFVDVKFFENTEFGTSLPEGTKLYTQPQPAHQGSLADEWLEALAQRAEDSDITYEATYDPGYDKPIYHDCYIEEQVADWVRAQKDATPQPTHQGSVPEGVIRQCEDAIQHASEASNELPPIN